MPEMPPQGPPPGNGPEKEVDQERARLVEHVEELFKSMARKWAALLAETKFSKISVRSESGSSKEREFADELFAYLHEDYDPRIERYSGLILAAITPHSPRLEPPPGPSRREASPITTSEMMEMAALQEDLGPDERPVLRAAMMDLRAAILAYEYSTGEVAMDVLKRKFLQDLADLAKHRQVKMPDRLRFLASRESSPPETGFDIEKSLARLRGSMEEHYRTEGMSPESAREETAAHLNGLTEEGKETLEDELRAFFQDPAFRDDPGVLVDMVIGEPPEVT